MPYEYIPYQIKIFSELPIGTYFKFDDYNRKINSKLHKKIGNNQIIGPNILLNNDITIVEDLECRVITLDPYNADHVLSNVGSESLETFGDVRIHNRCSKLILLCYDNYGEICESDMSLEELKKMVEGLQEVIKFFEFRENVLNA